MKRNKKRIVEIKLSTTFLSRTKCRYCNDFSNFIYRIRNYLLDYDTKICIQKFEYIKSNVKRMCDDYYLSLSPKFFKDTSFFNHSVSYKGYNPRLHRLRDVKKDDYCTEFISCRCGFTNWAINYKLCENQLSFNRKSRHVHDRKFSL